MVSVKKIHNRGVSWGALGASAPRISKGATKKKRKEKKKREEKDGKKGKKKEKDKST